MFATCTLVLFYRRFPKWANFLDFFWLSLAFLADVEKEKEVVGRSDRSESDFQKIKKIKK